MQKHLTLLGLIAVVAILGLSALPAHAYSSYGSNCSQPGCHAGSGATNNPPVANAGPDQTVDEGRTVTLNGSASSDPDGDALTYAWSQTGGDTVEISNPASATASFTAPLVTSGSSALTFTLTVTDSNGDSDSDSCIVNVSQVNAAPTANAGLDQSATAGDAVKLSGLNSSDTDDGIASYAWVQTSGSSVSLTGADTAEPGFTAPTPNGDSEVLVFELTVTDAGGLADTDTVSITVTAAPTENAAPTADAGPDQNVPGATQVALSGANSADSDGTIVAWKWTQTKGEPVTLSDANSAEPTFIAPEALDTNQELTFSLTVTDDAGMTASDACTVTVAALDAPQPNEPPLANAGPDQNAAPGENVVLDGSASSDSDDGIGAWLWTQTGGPQVVLAASDSDVTSFTAPDVTTAATLTFELKVTDNAGVSSTDVCVVNVQPGNAQGQQPTAYAGEDQTVSRGEVVTLDASGSTDPDGSELTFSWKQLAGKPVTLSAANVATPTFTMPERGGRTALVFEVTVTDADGMKSTDQVRVSVASSTQGGQNGHGKSGKGRSERNDD